MEDLKGMLQHRAELIEEALYFVNALENEDYACDDDKQKLEEDGLFDPGPVRAAWNRFLDGGGNLQHGIWGLLQAQAWLERWA